MEIKHEEGDSPCHVDTDTDTLPHNFLVLYNLHNHTIHFFLVALTEIFGSFTHILHQRRTSQTHKSRAEQGGGGARLPPPSCCCHWGLYSSRCCHCCCYWCRWCRGWPITWPGGRKVLGGIASDPWRPLMLLVLWILSIGCRSRLRARGSDKQRTKTTTIQWNSINTINSPF